MGVNKSFQLNFLFTLRIFSALICSRETADCSKYSSTILIESLVLAAIVTNPN
jgi:hypothetical protein